MLIFRPSISEQMIQWIFKIISLQYAEIKIILIAYWFHQSLSCDTKPTQ